MSDAVQFEWRIPRWQKLDDTLPVRGLDLTGGTFTLEVRAYRDAPGAALLALANATPPAQGISVSVATVDGVVVSTLRFIIDEAAINALLPFPDNGLDPNRDVVVAYCLKFTATGFSKRRLMEGALVLVGGANKS